MKPAPTETDALVNRLRQQLILAQVRVMEIEDERDELAPKLAETSRLLAAAQTLADQKLEEAAHLEKVRADIQTQYDHLRHIQHVTHLELENVRQQLAKARADIDEIGRLLRTEQQTSSTRQAQIDSLNSHATSLESQLGDLHRNLSDTGAESSRRLVRITELDQEVRSMKASRSWRWTTWLRSLERAFRPNK